jgi:outer membrane protein insertion porin family
VDGVSQGFDLYKRKTNATTLAVGPYNTDAVGGGIKFGYPISEKITVSFGLNAESVKLETFETSPPQYINFVSVFGNSYRYGTASAGWAMDTRDSLINPRAGALSRVTSEFAGGDLQFYRLGYQQQYFYPVGRLYSIFLKGDLGYAGGLGGKPLPFFKNYYAGGADSVRGYNSFSLGPKDVNGGALGGNRRVLGSAEFQFPMPGATKEQALRLGWFVDAGQVYGADQKVDLGELRYSTGLALNWASPFGPLRLSFGTPIHRREGDNIQRLQFTFGTAF